MSLNKHSIDKAYVSEYDKFLHGFDKKNPELSASQRKEKEKFDKLYALRDGKASAPKSSLLSRVLRVFLSE